MNEHSPRGQEVRLHLPESVKFPCTPERLRTYMEEAVTLLSLGAEADPVLVLRINNLPQSYYHQSVVWDRDTTAKEEKRIAKSMEKKAAELWVLLDQAPDRLEKYLGFWVGGVEARSLDDPSDLIPDPKWEVREPRKIDRARQYIAAIRDSAHKFVENPLPKPEKSPQRVMLEQAVQIAKLCGKTKEVGLELARKAHWAATGVAPEAGWGEFNKCRTRTRKG